MTPLVAAVVSLALPPIVLEAVLVVVFFAMDGPAEDLAERAAVKAFWPAFLGAFALVSLGLYHLMVQP